MKSEIFNILTFPYFEAKIGVNNKIKVCSIEEIKLNDEDWVRLKAS